MGREKVFVWSFLWWPVFTFVSFLFGWFEIEGLIGNIFLSLVFGITSSMGLSVICLILGDIISGFIYSYKKELKWYKDEKAEKEKEERSVNGNLQRINKI